MDKLAKVRAEIERLKEIAEYNLSHSKMDRGAWMQQASVCTNLLSFVDSMQEEPASEDLGEYISELSKQFPEVSFAKLSRIAVRVAKWQKQQMMTKAVEVEISDNGCTKGLQFIPVWPFTDEYVGGDKVKLIIIKED